MNTRVSLQNSANDLVVFAYLYGSYMAPETVEASAGVEVSYDDFEEVFVSSNLPDINVPVESESIVTMLASEAVLARDWDDPDEAEAWDYLYMEML